MDNPLPKKPGISSIIPMMMGMYGGSIPSESVHRKPISPYKKADPFSSMEIPNSPARKAKKKANRQKRYKNRKRRGY